MPTTIVFNSEGLSKIPQELQNDKKILIITGEQIAISGIDSEITFVIDYKKISKQSIYKVLKLLFDTKRICSLNAKDIYRFFTIYFGINPRLMDCIQTRDLILSCGKKQNANLTSLPPSMSSTELANKAIELSRAYKAQSEEIKRMELAKIAEIEADATAAFAQMETFGIPVNYSKYTTTLTEFLDAFERAKSEVLKCLNPKIWTQNENFNIKSPQMLLGVLREMGIMVVNDEEKKELISSTSKQSLKRIIGKEALKEALMEFRRIDDVLSDLKSIPKFVKNDNTIYPTVNQIGTVTGRPSTENPNINGYSPEIWGLFGSGKAKIITGDWTQFELRILAFLSNDKNLKAAISAGDVHLSTARSIFQKPIESGSPERDMAKKINFALIYGQSYKSLAIDLGCSQKEAKELAQKHKETYPDVYRFMADNAKTSAKKRIARSHFGRIRVLEEDLSDASAGRAGANMVIQGTGADILKIALGDLAKRIHQEHLPMHICSARYDDISIVSLDRHDECAKVLRQCMERAFITAGLELTKDCVKIT